MRFPTEIPESLIPDALVHVAYLIGEDRLRTRAQGILRDGQQNPLSQHFYQSRYSLELSFFTALDLLRRSGTIPWPPTDTILRLYSFVFVFAHVHHRLSSKGKARLVGAARAGLEKEFGLAPLAFELTIAAHFARDGYEVEFHDYERGGGFDFLVSRGALSVEIECKHFSADAGRQVHRRKLHDLSRLVIPIAGSYLGKRERLGRLIKVTLPGKLSGAVEFQHALASEVGLVINEDYQTIIMPNFTIKAHWFAITDSPFLRSSVQEDDIYNFLRDRYGIENSNHLIIGRPQSSTIIVNFSSDIPDQVIGTILDRLKFDSKRQFTRQRPSVLCVQLADITAANIAELATLQETGQITPLQLAMSRLIVDRPHLHTIALMAEVTSQADRDELDEDGRTFRGGGRLFAYANRNHPNAKDFAPFKRPS